MNTKEKIIKSLYDLQTIISLIIIFALASIFMMFSGGFFGGALQQGFPFVYYFKAGGVPSAIPLFNLSYLIIDLFIYYILSVFVSFLIKRKK